jgi:hypothetical protein
LEEEVLTILQQETHSDVAMVFHKLFEIKIKMSSQEELVDCTQKCIPLGVKLADRGSESQSSRPLADPSMDSPIVKSH